MLEFVGAVLLSVYIAVLLSVYICLLVRPQRVDDDVHSRTIEENGSPGSLNK